MLCFVKLNWTDRLFYGGFSVRHPVDIVFPRNYLASRYRWHQSLPWTWFLTARRIQCTYFV